MPDSIWEWKGVLVDAMNRQQAEEALADVLAILEIPGNIGSLQLSWLMTMDIKLTNRLDYISKLEKDVYGLMTYKEREGRDGSKTQARRKHSAGKVVSFDDAGLSDANIVNPSNNELYPITLRGYFDHEEGLWLYICYLEDEEFESDDTIKVSLWELVIAASNWGSYEFRGKGIRACKYAIANYLEYMAKALHHEADMNDKED